MILHNDIKNVETNLPGNSKSFTIKTSAKAFSILSSSLYSDKIKAVIRELSCNAYDSHKSVGKKDVPIEVHLPNLLEPFFYVKDEGLGLSTEQVMNLYTTYFESTKSDSNDQIGALGLGSKSPFSYTDTFTIVSNFNGLQGHYVAYLGTTGEPCINHIASIETTQPNGVMITIPVQEKDFKDFNSKASLVFRPFDVKPNIVGANCEPSEYVNSRTTFTHKGDFWELNNMGTRYVSNIYAVQGCIDYPIDKQSLKVKENHKVDFLFAQNSLVINFDLGELDISASRESLSYDEVTSRNIVTKLEIIYDELLKDLKEKFSEMKYYYDACVFLFSYKSKFFDLELLTKGSDFLFDGKLLLENIPLEHKTHLVSYYNKYSSYSNVARYKITGYIRTGEIDSDKNEFYINDIGMKGITRIRYNIPANVTRIVLNSYNDVKLIGCNYKLASSLPEVPKNNTSSGTYTKNIFKKLDIGSEKVIASSYSFSNKLPSAVEKFDTIYYIPVLGKDVDKSKHSSYKCIVDFAVYFGLVQSKSEIIGINSKYLNTLKDKTYINIGDVVIDKILKLKDNEIFINTMNIINDISKYDNLPYDVRSFFKVIRKPLLMEHNVKSKFFNEIRTTLDFINLYSKSVSSGKISTDKHIQFLSKFIPITEESTLIGLISQIEETYPIIKLMNLYNVSNKEEHIKTFLGYVNLVDNSN